jgi:hypothetical protein
VAAKLIEAKIFVPITEPNTEGELAAMTTYDRELIKRGLKQSYKVTGEELVAQLTTEDREEVRKKAVELCLKYHPKPLSVRLNTNLNRTFLLNRKYSRRDPNALCESIAFIYGGKAKEMIEDMLEKQWEKRRQEEEQQNQQQSSSKIAELDEKEIHQHMRTEIKRHELNQDLDRISGVRLAQSADDIEEDESYFMSTPYITLAEVRRRDEIEGRYDENNITKIAFDNIVEFGRFLQRPPFAGLQNYLQYYSKEYGALGGIGGGLINNLIPDAVSRMKHPKS